MAKNSGNIRTSASRTSRGNGSTGNNADLRAVNQRLADTFGRASQIDPDDLLYSTLADSPRSMIERAIEANTDYDVVEVTGTTVNLINRNGESSDYVNNDPVHEYYGGSKSIVEIFRELRDKSERSLFNKDFR